MWFSLWLLLVKNFMQWISWCFPGARISKIEICGVQKSMHQKICLGVLCMPYVVPHNILIHFSKQGYFDNPFYFIFLFSSFLKLMNHSV